MKLKEKLQQMLSAIGEKLNLYKLVKSITNYTKHYSLAGSFGKTENNKKIYFWNRTSINDEFNSWYDRMGKRLEKFRKGDRAEYLTQLFLSSISFSNPTYRQEDWGVDFICSLINRPNIDDLYPAETFSVQVKTINDARKRFLILENLTHNLDWFYKRQEPFFLCHLETEKQELYFYQTSHLHKIAIDNNTKFDRIKAKYDISINGNIIQNGSYDYKFQNNEILYDLGKPFMTLTMDDLLVKNLDRLEFKKNILKYAIEKEKINISLRNLGVPFYYWLESYVTNNEIKYAWKHSLDNNKLTINEPNRIFSNTVHILASIYLGFKEIGDDVGNQNAQKIAEIFQSFGDDNETVNELINVLGINGKTPTNNVLSGETKDNKFDMTTHISYYQTTKPKKVKNIVNQTIGQTSRKKGK